jgi:hypothetical protein
VLPKDHEFFVEYVKKLLTNHPLDTSSDFQVENLPNRFKATISKENETKKRKPSNMETSKAKNQKQEKATDDPEKTNCQSELERGLEEIKRIKPQERTDLKKKELAKLRVQISREKIKRDKTAQEGHKMKDKI